MDAKRILAELEAERARIDRAIAAIREITSDGARRSTTASQGRRRSRMSVAARKRLSQLMRKRWASGKMGKRRKGKAA